MMRRIRIFFAFALCCAGVGVSFASLSADEFIAQYQQASSSLSQTAKKSYALKLYNSVSLSAVRSRNIPEQYALYTSLKKYFKDQISSLGSGVSSSGTLVTSGFFLPKVNADRVRDAWLSRHNTTRSAAGLQAFVYAPVLEGTATTRANYLAKLGKTTHKRTSSDGYYSYVNIKTRFQDQGVVFLGTEKNGQTLFTENLARNVYSCKKADCTDDFIAAIKKAWNFFMSEKGSSYRPHYNAIVGNYSHIGLGVAVVGNKYYLVSHYTQDLK